MEFLLAIVLAAATGAATTAQGATNAALGNIVGAVQASLVSFAGGLVLISLICFVWGTGDITLALTADPWKLPAGFYGAFIVCMMAYCTPRLGAALTLTLLMFGQLVGGITIDSLGLLETTAIPLSPLRVLGVVAVLAGIIVVYIGRLRQDGSFKRATSISGGEPLAQSRATCALLAFLSGLVSAIQTPTNAALSAITGTLESSTINFINGFCVLLVATLILNRGHLKSLRGIAPWKFTGGAYGAFGVPAVTFATPILGVSLTLGCEMALQLIGGLLLDGFGWLQVPRTPVDRLRVVGALIVAAGVVLVTISRL